MKNPIKNFFLASFNEQELEAFIKEKQEAKDKALDKMYRKAIKRATSKRLHSNTFHEVVSAVRGLGFNKAIKQELVSEWLNEAMI